MRKLDLKISKILGVVFPDRIDKGFRSDAPFFGLDHDGRAMGIVCTDVMALMTAHFLKAGPKIGLQVLDQMTEVDRSIGIGQGSSEENSSIFH